MTNLLIQLKIIQIGVALATLTAQAATLASTSGILPNNTEAPYIANLSHYEALLSLEQCENKNGVYRVLDVNGYYSYGALMFQLETFKRYGEKYGLISPGKTNEELRELTKNRFLQFQIANKILEDGEWWHWTNCWKKQKLSL